MPKKPPRVFSREFKLAAVRRILAGERIKVLSQELNVLRKDLYAWRDLFRAGGPAALRPLGRPRKTGVLAMGAHDEAGEAMPEGPAAESEIARRRIAELERKIGQQQLELDFFRQALRQVKEARRPSTGPGVTGSTRSSKP
jgi:transposase-like protein